MPGADTITIFRGEDVTLEFETKDDDGGVVDISGWAVELTIGDSTGDVLQKSGTVDDGPAGLFSFGLASSETAALVVSSGRYKYDAWRDNVGSKRILAIGKLVVKKIVKETP